MEDVGQRVGKLPALGQAGLQLEVLVAGEQAVEEQLVDAFRLRVGPDARVEVGGAALDDHHQRLRVGPLGAGKKQQGEANTDGEPAPHG